MTALSSSFQTLSCSDFRIVLPRKSVMGLKEPLTWLRGLFCIDQRGTKWSSLSVIFIVKLTKD